MVFLHNYGHQVLELKLGDECHKPLLLVNRELENPSADKSAQQLI